MKNLSFKTIMIIESLVEDLVFLTLVFKFIH
jgi:hypothetical protein